MTAPNTQLRTAGSGPTQVKISSHSPRGRDRQGFQTDLPPPSTHRYARRLILMGQFLMGQFCAPKVGQVCCPKWVNFWCPLTARLHRWPFRVLQQKIEDKACRAGIEVIFVDPRYTSKTCPHCNAIGTRYKHRFVCKSCGYRAHSDLNGGRNLQRLGCLLITQGLV